ncbi:Ppx/GppA family phosphatase [Campylobacter sp. VicNov18]|uniref:Ppx/GppA phosphatase family protein n=1 Tax=Campylobacter bilis TaxID=2691918 RepID=UPI00130DFDD8|nr:Ppx/GppA family phosphatase [Campylobacter bilis]MPV63141.1 Ppx/GppA family phosphatase [Campylobacter hepaticus]MBM0636641.1 Ppx/GppA family phosphatase [Campylobacter bilis]MCC8277485.1 Ppx/GppA family phosphatase [Campylobacter bilis]MCC8298690.1 Ppx/GppA family phosphatase [Campylobacter bilis]MCC8300394.1 Ppx/GppA family phosphatase [Campylobacter bilis]
MLGIDLGSNTLRAVQMDEEFKKIKEYEFVVGAARNLNQSGKISQEAIKKLKDVLKVLAKEQDLSKAKAVATAAFRKASNTQEIFDNLKEEFGIIFELIDPKIEAKMSVLGMQAGLLELGIWGEFAYCDLGGASCELAFKNSFISFDFGIISFYEKNQYLGFKTNTFYNKILKQYPQFITRIKDKKLKIHFLIKDNRLKYLAFKAFDEVDKIKKVLKSFKVKTVILNSGVPTMLSALKQNRIYEGYEASKINGTRLCHKDFLNYAIKLFYMQEHKTMKQVSMRNKYLSAGCLLFYALFDRHKLLVIDEGLREGLCLASMKNIKF